MKKPFETTFSRLSCWSYLSVASIFLTSVVHAAAPTFGVGVENSSETSEDGTKVYTLNFKSLNKPPVITSTSKSSILEEKLYTYKIKANDPDGDKLEYSLSNTPEGLSLFRNKISWKPSYKQAGQYTFTIIVSDGKSEAEELVVLDVINANRTPQWGSNKLSDMNEGEILSRQIQASDDDEEKLKFFLTAGPKGMKLSESGLLTWKLGYESAGEQVLDIVATDDIDQIKLRLKFNVSNVNRAPLFNAEALTTANEMDDYVYRLNIADPDNQPLTIRLLKSPVGMQLVDQQLVWTPSYEQAGSYPVNVEISDGDLTARQDFILKVKNTNRLPQLVNLAVPPAKETVAFSMQLQAQDDDGSQVNFKLKKGPSGLSVSDTGEVNWTPGYEFSGEHKFVVTLNDGEDDVDASVVISVENTNRVPVLKTAEIKVATENQAFMQQLYATDPDGDELSYSIALPSKPGFESEAISVSPKGMVNWLPGMDVQGSHELELTVSDGDLEVVKKLPFTVINTNRAPTINSEAATTVQEVAEYRYKIMGVDPDNDDLKYNLLSGPKGLKLINDEIVWTPGYEDAGMYTYKVVVSDGVDRAVQEVNLEVLQTNRSPSLLTKAFALAKEDRAYSIQLESQDPDKDVLSYVLLNGPEGMSISPTGLLTWTPNFAQEGEHVVSIELSDSLLRLEYNLPIKVENTNQPPVFQSQPPASVAEAQVFQYNVQTYDGDAQQTSLKLISGPEGMLLEQKEQGMQLTWQPDFEAEGNHDVLLELRDPETVTQQAFTIKVNNTNRKPDLIEPPLEALQLSESAAWAYEIVADDPDREAVAIELFNAPEGLTLEGKTLKWQPTYEQAGEYMIAVSAKDKLSQVQQRWILNVANLNRLPSISSKPAIVGSENQPYVYPVLATDPDNNLLAYSLIDPPEGMAMLEGAINWTPNYDQSGVHEINLQVSDGEATVSQTFIVTVENTNRAPVFDTKPQLTAKENSVYEYPVSASDPDNHDIRIYLIRALEGATFKDNILRWPFDYESAGSYQVELQVKDKESMTKQAFTIVVENVNRLPVVESKANKVAYENVEYIYNVEASDADASTLAYTLVKHPSGMKMVDNKISWTPSFDQSGKHVVKVTVSDGEDRIAQDYTIDVKNTNREPDSPEIEDQQLVWGQSFKQAITSSDIDGDQTKIKLVHAPKGMSLDNKNRLLWKPVEKQIGLHTVIVHISDGDLRVTRHFDIQVIDKD